jgi:tRNA(fMet)-specific endonuclease VapC
LGIVIDSSVFIATERGASGGRFASRLAERLDEDVGLAAITVSELLHGVHRANQATVKARREAFVETILATLAVLPFDERVARIHARLWATLAAKGTNVAAHDLIIAATALAYGWSVATQDTRSFPKVPGLKVELWK